MLFIAEIGHWEALEPDRGDLRVAILALFVRISEILV